MHYLLRHRDVPGINAMSVYVGHRGYDGLRRAMSMPRTAVVEEVANSGLRGRGGAGFPTGRKWSLLDRSQPARYLVVNADWAEPVTFEDRELIEHNPHQIIEGALITAYTLNATEGFIFVRGELLTGYESLLRARDAGYIGSHIFNSEYSINLRRGNRPAGVHRGAARPSPYQASLPSPGWIIWTAHRRQQCGNGCQHSGHHHQRGGLVSELRHQRITGD